MVDGWWFDGCVFGAEFWFFVLVFFSTFGITLFGFPG